MEEKNFIGSYGVFATIVVAVIGMDVFSYPSVLVEIVGSDGWIVTILNGVINLMFLYLIYMVVRKNNYGGLYTILTKNLGKFFGSIMALVFAAYTILYLSEGLRIFAEVIKMYLLHQTPTEFIIIILIFSGLYLIRGGVNSLVKFNELAFGFMAVTLVIVFLFAISDADFTNVLPILNNKPINYINGIRSTLGSFAGFEMAYIILPLVKKKKNIKKTFGLSMLLITTLYILVCVFTLAVFSKAQTKTLLWPTITMIKSIDIPGAFIERWEGVVMAIWVLFYFTTFSNLLYFSSDIFKNVFSLEDVKLSSIIVIPIIYLTAMYGENIAEVYNEFQNISDILFVVNIVFLPILLIIISSFKKKGGSNNGF